MKNATQKKHPGYTIAELLAKDIEMREALDPNHYYEAKLPSIRRAQMAGLSDDTIERLFNITLRDKDRRK
jgi:hypothetical protein